MISNGYNFESMEQLEFLTRSGIQVRMSDLKYLTQFRIIYINSTRVDDTNGHTWLLEGKFFTNVRLVELDEYENYTPVFAAMRNTLLAMSARAKAGGGLYENIEDAFLNAAAAVGCDGRNLITLFNAFRNKRASPHLLSFVTEHTKNIQDFMIWRLEERTKLEIQEEEAGAPPMYNSVRIITDVMKSAASISKKKALWTTIIGIVPPATAAVLWSVLGTTLSAINVAAPPAAAVSFGPLAVGVAAVAITGIAAKYVFTKQKKKNTANGAQYKVVRKRVRLHENEEEDEEEKEEIVGEEEIAGVNLPDVIEEEAFVANVNTIEGDQSGDYRRVPVYHLADEDTLVPEPTGDRLLSRIGSVRSSAVHTATHSRIASKHASRPMSALASRHQSKLQSAINSPEPEIEEQKLEEILEDTGDVYEGDALDTVEDILNEEEVVDGLPVYSEGFFKPSGYHTLAEVYAATMILWDNTNRDEMMQYLTQLDEHLKKESNDVKEQLAGVDLFEDEEEKKHVPNTLTVTAAPYPETPTLPVIDIQYNYKLSRLHHMAQALGYESVGNMFLQDGDILEGAVETIAMMFPGSLDRDKVVDNSDLEFVSKGLFDTDKFANVSFTMRELVELYDVDLTHYMLREWAIRDLEISNEYSEGVIRRKLADEPTPYIKHHLEKYTLEPFTTSLMYPLKLGDVSLLIAGSGNQGYFVRKLISLTEYTIERHARARQFIYRAICNVTLGLPFSDFYTTDWGGTLPYVAKMNDSVIKWMHMKRATNLRIRNAYNRYANYFPPYDSRLYRSTFSVTEYAAYMEALRITNLDEYYTVSRLMTEMSAYIDTITSFIVELRLELVGMGPDAESKTLFKDPVYRNIAPHFYTLWHYDLPGMIDDLIFLCNAEECGKYIVSKMHDNVLTAQDMEKMEAQRKFIKSPNLFQRIRSSPNPLKYGFQLVPATVVKPQPVAPVLSKAEEMLQAELIADDIGLAENVHEEIEEIKQELATLSKGDMLIVDLPIKSQLMTSGNPMILNAMLSMGAEFITPRPAAIYRIVEISTLVERSIFMLMERWNSQERFALMRPEDLRTCFELGMIVAMSDSRDIRREASHELAKRLHTTVKSISADVEVAGNKAGIARTIAEDEQMVLELKTKQYINMIAKAETIKDLLDLEPLIFRHINKLSKAKLPIEELSNTLNEMKMKINMRIEVGITPSTEFTKDVVYASQPVGWKLSTEQRRLIELSNPEAFDPDYDYSVDDLTILTDDVYSPFRQYIRLLSGSQKIQVVMEKGNPEGYAFQRLIPAMMLKSAGASERDVNEYLGTQKKVVVPTSSRNEDLKILDQKINESVVELKQTARKTKFNTTLRKEATIHLDLPRSLISGVPIDRNFERPPGFEMAGTLTMDNLQTYTDNMANFYMNLTRMNMPADPTAYFEPIIDFRMTNVILPVVTYSIEQTGIWRRINLNARPGATDWIMEWLTSVWRFVGPHNIVPVAQSDAALTFRRKMIDNGIVYIAVSPSWYWSAYHQILDYYAHPVLAATQAIIEPYFSMYAPLTRNWIMLSLQYDSFYAPVYTDQQKKEVAWKLVCFNGLYNGTSTLPHMKDERGFFNTFARRPCACLLQWVVDKGATGRVPTRTSPAPSIQYSSTVHAPEQLYKPDPVHDALASQNLNAEYTAIADTILERINVPPSVIFQEYLKYRANYLNVSDATSFIDYFITLHADKHR